MNDTIFYYASLKESIRDNDWRDAIHYSAKLKTGGFFENKSRQGWRLFECEKFQIEDYEYGCGYEFLEPTRDFLSPSISTCPHCGEDVAPLGGYYDETLKVNSSFNLTNQPKPIILNHAN